MSCSLTAFGLTANIKVHGVVIAAPCEVEKNNYLIDLKKINIWNIKDTQKSPWVDFSVETKKLPCRHHQSCNENIRYARLNSN